MQSEGTLTTLGFSLGGLCAFGVAPSPGIVLLPVGAILLFAAAVTTARCAAADVNGDP